MIKKTRTNKADILYLLLVLLLGALGTLMIFSAGYAYAEFRYSDKDRKSVV